MMKKYRILLDKMLLMPVATSEIAMIEQLRGEKTGLYRIFYQIQALRDIQIPNGKLIKSGDFGGHIQSHWNLNPFDESWVDQGAIVMQNAQVTDNAYVGNNVILRLAFITPPESSFDADHTIVIDNEIIYSHKHKKIIGYTEQSKNIEWLRNNSEKAAIQSREWLDAVEYYKERG